MTRACLLAGWVLMVVLPTPSARADGLRKVDAATSGGSRSSSSSSSSSSRGGWSSRSSSGSSSSWSSSSSSDSGDDGDFLLFALTIGSPWGIPRLFFDDPSLSRYAPYPFADGPGVLRRTLEDGVDDGARKFAVALDAESGFMLQRVVPSGLALRVMMPYRMELDLRLTGLSDVTRRPVEVASAGTAHVTYRFAQGRRHEFRTGLGLRSFQLGELRLGFDLWYGVDAYIASCVVWRMELHMGSAGDAFVGQARTTLGAMIGRFEMYAGYDHTAYISETTSAALGGPIAGLRAWF